MAVAAKSAARVEMSRPAAVEPWTTAAATAGLSDVRRKAEYLKGVLPHSGGMP